jgi:hypothetical protein
MSDSTAIPSIRITFAAPPRGGDPAAVHAAQTRPNERMRQAISRGLQMLAFRAAKDRFTGKGPFPVSQRKLGNVSGRLKRDLHAEAATMTATGYRGRVGSVVEYFGPHEVGFSGQVSVRAHSRKAYTVGGKRGYTVLPQSVRAHSKTLKIPARQPLATAIREHGQAIIGGEIAKAARGTSK